MHAAKRVAFGATLAVFAASWIAPRWPRLPSGQALALAVMLVMCASLVYEWAEWAIALMLSPEAAEAYNGQQGDPWDAHADMLLATLGALLAWPLARERNKGARA